MSSLHTRRTKIVATLGPASVPKIRQLIQAGVNVFRLNFSHVTDPETQTPIIETIRRESDDLKIPVAILGDLGGPKIRCNGFKGCDSIPLVAGSTVRLVTSDEPGSPGVITTNVAVLVSEIQPGHRVLLDDGTMRLVMERRISETEVEMKVVVGGTLKPHKGINVPDMRLAVPALTEKDRRDAMFMWDHQLEYVALSFVQIASDVQALLDLFRELRPRRSSVGSLRSSAESLRSNPGEEIPQRPWRPLIISKIEKPQALDSIDGIIAVSDGIMVARGDLGVEVSLERVPLIQKTLIRKANMAEKPVITATQMLESMINAPVPTRAEVSDVANAVMDGTDAVMLSGECAVGQFPVETVEMMGSICRNAESGDSFMLAPAVSTWEGSIDRERRTFGHPIADAAVAAADEARAEAIIVFTYTGDMAYFVSKRRPARPIIAITHKMYLYRRLSLLYGVFPVLSTALPADGTHLSAPLSTEQLYLRTEQDIINHGLAKSLGLSQGCTVAYCAGFHGPWPALSYSVRLSKFRTTMVM